MHGQQNVKIRLFVDHGIKVFVKLLRMGVYRVSKHFLYSNKVGVE